MGVLMNTRGIVQLVVLNIGVQLKVISPVIFAMFVLMATILTIFTSPILSILYAKIDENTEPTDGDKSLDSHHNGAYQGDQVKVDLSNAAGEKIDSSTLSHSSSIKTHRRRMTLF